MREIITTSRINKRKTLLSLCSYVLATLSLLCISCSNSAPEKSRELKVLQFNVWQEGTVVPNGFSAIIDEIVRTEADLVAFSEVRNYNETSFIHRVIDELKGRGLTFYGTKTEDTGLISKFPIDTCYAVFPLSNDHGSVTKAAISLPDSNQEQQRLIFYSAHLDYLNCSYYMPRGYSGTTWDELDRPVTSIDTLISSGRLSLRDDAVKAVIKDFKREQSIDNCWAIIGGDFNEPSHRDWIEANADIYDHSGVVIDWECTTMLEAAGFIDTYREIYPDPLKNPGFTYPAYISSVPISKLTWAPKSDERERIDFIFYNATDRVKLVDAIIVGPEESVLKSAPHTETTDLFSRPETLWPTDHKALLSTFRY